MAAGRCLTQAVPSARTLLFLAYYFPPDNESGAARPARFRKYLQREGWSTRVIARTAVTGIGDRARHEPEATTPLPAARYTALANFAQRFILPYNDGLGWVPHAIAAAGEVIGKQHAPIIFSTSPPAATHVAALFLKREFNLPWVADFRDPLRGNFMRTGIRSAICDSMLERAIFQNADALIANTDAVAEMWRDRYPRHAHKISVIYNGFDPEEQIAALPAESHGRRVITHAGAIYGGRDPELLLESIRRLIERNELDPSSFLLRFIGDIQRDSLRKPELLDWHEKRGCLELSNGVLPKAQADDAIARSHYLLLMDNNQHGSSQQVPAKLFNYIRLGRFILALTPKGSSTERILARSGVPHVCLPGDTRPEDVDRNVLAMLSRTAEPAKPSAWFNAQFNAVNQTDALMSVLSRFTDI
jgi:glycosyltransferase involved in cell wall biosynthesis